ncbi:MAG: hypothetical protein R3290_08025, partial [Acidimicrobiia bacterium]|nr:hypothetical protein [Acidimicrobiia bacterium]
MNDAIGALERVNRGLAPGSLSEPEVNELLARYARVAKLAAYGTTVLSGRLRDARTVARVTGTSVGRARRTLATAEALERTPELDEAMRTASVSADEAAEIARTETEAPGATADLLEVAASEGFGVLRDRARDRRLAATDRTDLADRQRKARSLRHRVTDLGMVRVEADLEPHVGAGLVARLEATATRLHRRTPTAEREPMPRYL